MPFNTSIDADTQVYCVNLALQRMKVRILLAGVLLINLALLLLTLAPGLVTYAEIPPKRIVCADCANPVVQRALSQAAAAGRAQVQEEVISHLWLLAALTLATICASVGVALQGKSEGRKHVL